MTDYLRVNFIVEGQTEETFVRDVLQEHLVSRGVLIAVRCVQTGRQRGKIFRGGMTSFARAERDIRRWLAEDPSAYLTTMFDLYRLPVDFPQYVVAKGQHDPYRKVAILEQALAEAIGSHHFIPHIQLHEFEGLLFSDVETIDAALSLHRRPSRLGELQAIKNAFANPEEINEGEETAPSKRLIKLYPGYDKPLFGPQIARRIGLASIRAQCPHFAAWLARLENIRKGIS